jgi:hypothetical protein
MAESATLQRLDLRPRHLAARQEHGDDLVAAARERQRDARQSSRLATW